MGHVDRRSQVAVTYDTTRGRLVMMGGYSGRALFDTWEWDGAWTFRTCSTCPGTRHQHALAHDAARGRTVLFGGSDDNYALSETWAWDGVVWTQANPVTVPSRRIAHAMTYDESRRRIVMFGGRPQLGAGGLAETWEWDGTDWLQLAPAATPPPRYDHALAYDAARRRVVLFGGADGSTRFGDTWEWDGSNWSQRSPGNSPAPRSWHALAYDSRRGRVVLFGGEATGGVLADTWEWDGTAWSQRQTANVPPARRGHGLAYDAARAQVVLCVGNDGTDNLADTWTFDGNDWTLRSLPIPPQRVGNGLAYDERRGLTVLFGGSNLADTWEWDGTTWSDRQPANRPTARGRHVTWWDTVRRRVMVFGGESGPPWVVLGDFWEWDGLDWAQLSTPTLPPPRVAAAVAVDTRRNVAVLFGGYGSTLFGDTWEWDGTAWTQRLPATSPPARSAHAMAYDPVRGVTVLCGGSTSSGRRGDTWEWDGTNWTQRAPANPAPPDEGHLLVHDPERNRTVFLGGVSSSPSVLEWDGNDWLPGWVNSTLAQTRRFGGAATYDSRRGRVITFGGVSYGTYSDTWEYGATHRASYASIGAGCAGSSGTPALAAAPWQRPWIGSSFPLIVTQLPAAAPAALLLGFSSRVFGQVPLPFDLGVLGMRQCWLRVSGEYVLPLATAGGSASLVLPLPPVRSLLGQSFFNQTLVVDPPANALGATMSNACEARIGGR